MVKNCLLTLALCIASSTLLAQNNPYDYYYPMDVQLIETEYYNGYEARYRYIKYDFVNLTKVLDRQVVANRGFSGLSFRDYDVDYVKNNTLYVNRIRVSGRSESTIEGYIIYKCPKGSETTTWVNSGRSSLGVYYYNNGEATRITIPYRGVTLQALRVIHWEEWGDGAKAETVFWVRNWGDALKFEADGTITWMNKGLFADDIKNTTAFKNALSRMKAIDDEQRATKVYNGGKVTFKPVAIPSDLLSFANEFKTAIKERKDLTPFLGGDLLANYQKDWEVRDNATESFAYYMKDPYFSGLDALADHLDSIEASCSIERFGQGGRTSYYVLPGYSSCIDQYKGNEEVHRGVLIDREEEGVKLGVVYKPLKAYKETKTNSKVNYTAEPYRLFIVSNGRWEDGVYWYRATTLDGKKMGYVRDKDIYLDEHYQFLIAKTEDGYRLTDVYSCYMTDTWYREEKNKRQREIEAFASEHENDAFSINTEFPDVSKSLKRVIDSNVANTMKDYSVFLKGLEESDYSLRFEARCLSRDRIEVKNTGWIPMDKAFITNAIAELYDNGQLRPATLLFQKYNHEIPLAGKYEYSQSLSAKHYSATMVLKNGQWIPDKNSVEVYNSNKAVCDTLVAELAANNPKAKKIILEWMTLTTPDGSKYTRIAETIKVKKQPDKFILGSEIVF